MVERERGVVRKRVGVNRIYLGGGGISMELMLFFIPLFPFFSSTIHYSILFSALLTHFSPLPTHHPPSQLTPLSAHHPRNLPLHPHTPARSIVPVKKIFHLGAGSYGSFFCICLNAWVVRVGG